MSSGRRRLQEASIEIEHLRFRNGQRRPHTLCGWETRSKPWVYDPTALGRAGAFAVYRRCLIRQYLFHFRRMDYTVRPLAKVLEFTSIQSGARSLSMDTLLFRK